MLTAIQKLLLMFAATNTVPNPAEIESNLSYENINLWGIEYPTCNGYHQSPINIRSKNALNALIPKLHFHNYDVPLMHPIIFVNNGHTINLDIPPTRNGHRPSISGGKMAGRYEAIGVHFHWGSPNNKGSEHMINGTRYNAEMHIVHKNFRYDSIEEAQQHHDGFTVFGILLQVVDNPQSFQPGLRKIFNKLPQLVEYESEARVRGRFTLNQLLGELNTEQFYTYKGSLTTPPCSQAVRWYVFPEPLPIAATQMVKFFDIMDSHNELLMDNYRPIQPRNGRKVLYRVVQPSYKKYTKQRTHPY